MKKICLFFVSAAFCAMAAQGSNHRLSTLEGTFLGIKNNLLILETQPKIHFRIPLGKNVRIISPAGPFPFLWLSPGDAIQVHLDQNGNARRIEVYASWTFGTVAFTSPDRLTLLEGPQFFIGQAPLFLNGERIESLSALDPPNEVLVRFDSLQKKTVGVWAFDRSEDFKQESNPIQKNAWIAASLEKNKLHIGVKAKPGGLLYARLLGATQRFAVREKRAGQYETDLALPTGVNIPRSYLQFEWLGTVNGEPVDSRWIFSKPISFYTQSPQVLSLGPTDGSTVPVNPPYIFANFDPGKSPLDLNSVHLLLDQRNVTPECYVNPYLVFFSPNHLSRGRHICSLSGRTLGGRGAFVLRWGFNVKS